MCSDIPGEFIWKPGPLYEASKMGYWLLLEDIDHSTSDLVSLLIDLLETNSINSNEIYLKINKNFRLFLTKRTNSDKVANSCYLNSLAKLSRCVKLEALKNDQIIEVVIVLKYLNRKNFKFCFLTKLDYLYEISKFNSHSI